MCVVLWVWVQAGVFAVPDVNVFGLTHAREVPHHRMRRAVGGECFFCSPAAINSTHAAIQYCNIRFGLTQRERFLIIGCSGLCYRVQVFGPDRRS